MKQPAVRQLSKWLKLWPHAQIMRDVLQVEVEREEHISGMGDGWRSVCWGGSFPILSSMTSGHRNWGAYTPSSSVQALWFTPASFQCPFSVVPFACAKTSSWKYSFNPYEDFDSVWLIFQEWWTCLFITSFIHSDVMGCFCFDFRLLNTMNWSNKCTFGLAVLWSSTWNKT